MGGYIFIYFFIGLITRNYVGAQWCETQQCLAHAEDIAHRMWVLADLGENYLNNIANQVAKTRHYQLALWHMTMTTQLEKHDVHAGCLSNHTNFKEPEITEVYQEEIQYIVDDFVQKKPNVSEFKGLQIGESEHVVNQLWAQICSRKLAITQELIASILKRQAYSRNMGHEERKQLLNLANHLHHHEIPHDRWKAIVQLTSSSLCSSDLCPWLHRMIEQIEHYLIEHNQETDYSIRIAHLIKGYCHEHIYAIIDAVVGHKRDDCDGTLQFDPADHEIYLAIPNPSDIIEQSYYDTPSSILLDVGVKHPFYNDISALKNIFDKVDKDKIIEKFGDNVLPKKINFLNFLLNDEDVQAQINSDKKLSGMAEAIALLMKLSGGNLSGHVTQDFDELDVLINYLPEPTNEEEAYNIEILKQLLEDPEELRNLLDEEIFENVSSDRELLEEIIRTVLMDNYSSKYEFNSGLYGVLDNLIENNKKPFHMMDEESDAEALHSISPLDTIVVEVDPTRLDRKPRFSQPGGFYSNETDRPKSTYSFRFSIPSPVLSVSPYDVDHLDLLVPLIPGKQGYHLDDELILEVKDLLKDASIREQILGEDFDINNYPTKVFLLERVFYALNHLTENGIVSVDAVLQDFIDLYYDVLEFTNEELGVAPKAIMRYNYANLLMLLPIPTESDQMYYEAIQSFMLDDDHIDYMVRDMDLEEYNTQAKILNYILTECIQKIGDEETSSSCKYYIDIPKDSAKGKQPLEKYVVYKKADLHDMDVVYVQLNPLNINASTITPTLQPETEGILQIPIPNKNLFVDVKDMANPALMIPDVETTFPMHYNLTNLQWQIRRPDAYIIFSERLNWNQRAHKVDAIEEILDRLIALALSDDIYLQEHSLNFAEIYISALKVSNHFAHSGSARRDYAEILKAALELTDNKDFIKECDELINILEQHDIMDRILGPTFTNTMFKNDVTLLRGVLKKIIKSNDPAVVNVKEVSQKILNFFKQLGQGYNIKLVTTIEQKMIDISDAIVKTFDRKALPKDLWGSYRKVLKFMVQQMNPHDHLPDFDFNDYKTKGEVVKNMFQTMIDHGTVNDDLKECMIKLLPYARLDGPAAELIGD